MLTKKIKINMNLILLYLILTLSLILCLTLIICESLKEKLRIIFWFSVVGGFLLLKLSDKISADILSDNFFCYSGILIILIHGYNFYTQYNFLMKSSSKSYKKNPIIEFFFICIKKLLETIFTSIMITCNTTLQLFPNLTTNLLKFFFWFNQYEYKYLIHFFVIIFNIIPRIILMCCCFIDICYFFEFYYFYKVLGLILIIIVFNSFAYFCKEVAMQAIAEIKHYLEIKIFDLKLTNFKITHVNFESNVIAELHDYTQNMLVKTYFAYFQIIATYQFMSKLKTKKWYYLSLMIISLGYIISWGYLIIRMILY